MRNMTKLKVDAREVSCEEWNSSRTSQNADLTTSGNYCRRVDKDFYALNAGALTGNIA